MSKFIKATLLFLGLLSSICYAANASLISIDVGHYKSRPGATSARGESEFYFNKKLANTIHKTFSSYDIQSTLIGEDGLMTSLQGRTALAKRQGANFFLSIHHDSVQPHYLEPWMWQGTKQLHSERFSGFSLFISRKNADAATSLHCAKYIGAALIHAGFTPSSHHAEQIQGENREWADKNTGVYYFDDLVVLKTATMPAVLLEAGIIINRDEELVMQSQGTQNLIANSVTQGLRACKAIK